MPQMISRVKLVKKPRGKFQALARGGIYFKMRLILFLRCQVSRNLSGVSSLILWPKKKECVAA